MSESRTVCLTGATGLLGRYLLRDLLAAGHRVAVLVRDAGRAAAAERVAELMAFAQETSGRSLPPPVVLAGDLTATNLGLSPADRQWLGRNCQAVVHAAASLAFRPTPDGEPRRTNVAGMAALLQYCRQLGIAEWHHVSTAYVCGRRRGAIGEDDGDCGQDFHNAYEESKLEAERLLHAAPGVRVTVYRPSVIVGDSCTGYTSNYAGLYRLLHLAARLADAGPATIPRRFPLRLPLRGTETGDVVPVDWVARAVVELLARPYWHGRTFHLTGRTPVSARLIRDVAAAELQLEGIEFGGAGNLTDPSQLEQLFLEGVADYWPYLVGGPEFLCRNTATALPHLPPPPVDETLLRRLIRFAVADRWGRSRRRARADSREATCAHYVEHVFPRQARQSGLARAVGLDLAIALDVCGPGGGQWSCRWTGGELAYVRRGLEPDAAVTYRTDTATFQAVVQGRETPPQAFFEQRIAITGNLETALKLAALWSRFLSENPYPSAPAHGGKRCGSRPSPAHVPLGRPTIR